MSRNNNTTAIDQKQPVAPITAVENALIRGDLQGLGAEDRVSYYRQVCESLGLNPLTRPFGYLSLNGKLQLYPLKDCTDQLRKRDQITIEILSREIVDDCFLVHVRATARGSNGASKSDEDFGAVHLGSLKGDARCNAMLKAITKAKRRVTLSICGLGFVDETEVDSIPDAQRVVVEEVTEQRRLPTPSAKNKQALPAPAPPPAAASSAPEEEEEPSLSVADGIKEAEVQLVDQHLCEPGELIAHMVEHLGDNWEDSSHEELQAACAEFSARQRRPIGDEELKHLKGDLKRTGMKWGALLRKVGLPRMQAAQLGYGEYCRVALVLAEMPDVAAVPA